MAKTSFKKKVKGQESEVRGQKFLRLNKGYILVIFFLILALVFRLIHLQNIEKNDPTFYQLPYGTDMVTYDNQAQNILKGKHPTPYYYGPLYSYFLALVYLIFGHNLYIARLIQMLLGVVTLFFIFLIADKVFGRKVAIISLCLASCYDMFILHEGLLLLETLTCFLNTISLFFLLKIEKEANFKNIFLSGSFLGLSALARANILLFFPFILIWMLKNLKLKTKNSKLLILRYALFCLITFLVISPATIMNYIASKKFILISTNGPVNLWIGNNERADGTFLQPSIPKRLEKRLKEIGDKAYIEEVIKFIKETPNLFINLLIKKFFLFWGAFEVANNMNYEQIKSYSSIMKLHFFIGFGIIGPLGLFGIFLSLRKKETLLLLLYIFSFMLSTIFLFVLGRYRIVFLPTMLSFAGFSIFWAYERILKKEYKKILFLSPLLLFSFIFVWHKEIYGISFPFIHPEGMHINKDNKVIVRDVSDEWKGEDCIVLSEGDKVKKELLINEDLSLFNEAEIEFKYGVGENPARLILTVNDAYSIIINFTYTQGLIKAFNTSIPINSLKKGKNSFVFSLEGESNFALPYNQAYSFGRSYQFKDSDFKKIEKGEFMVWISLKS